MNIKENQNFKSTLNDNFSNRYLNIYQTFHITSDNKMKKNHKLYIYDHTISKKKYIYIYDDNTPSLLDKLKTQKPQELFSSIS